MVSRSPRPPKIGEEFDAILAAAQAQRGWGFERLYRALSPPVAGYLRLQGSPEPDDLTNEVFLGAFGAIGSFQGDEEQFRSWLFTIAHRRLTDERRRRGRRPQMADRDLTDVAEPSGGDVEEDVLRRLSLERVRQLCDGLSPDQRDVLLLRMVSGLPIDEVAQALGKSPTAIKALQRRALGAVRRARPECSPPLCSESWLEWSKPSRPSSSPSPAPTTPGPRRETPPPIPWPAVRSPPTAAERRPRRVFHPSICRTFRRRRPPSPFR